MTPQEALNSPEQAMLGAIFMFLEEEGFEPTWTVDDVDDSLPSLGNFVPKGFIPADVFSVTSKPVGCTPITFRVGLVGAELMLTRSSGVAPESARTLHNDAFYNGEVRFFDVADPKLFDRVVEILS